MIIEKKKKFLTDRKPYLKDLKLKSLKIKNENGFFSVRNNSKKLNLFPLSSIISINNSLNKKAKSIDISDSNTTINRNWKSNSLLNIHPVNVLKKKYSALNTHKNIKKLKENIIKEKYKEIFKDQDKLFKPKKKEINNKYNLIFSESENEFRYRIEKINKFKLKRGLLTTHDLNLDKIANKENKKVDSVMEKIKYMKSIIDYSYPIIISKKNKIQSNNIHHHFSSISCFSYKEVDKKKNFLKKQLSDYITKSITITKISNK